MHAACLPNHLYLLRAINEYTPSLNHKGKTRNKYHQLCGHLRYLAILSAASDLTYTWCLSSKIIESTSGFSKLLDANISEAAGDCRLQNNNSLRISCLKMYCTALLHRLQTPSKNTIGLFKSLFWCMAEVFMWLSL